MTREQIKEDLEKVIKGFNLVKSNKGFEGAFVTKNGSASQLLANKINIFIKEKLKNDYLKVVYEQTYGTINFFYKN